MLPQKNLVTDDVNGIALISQAPPNLIGNDANLTMDYPPKKIWKVALVLNLILVICGVALAIFGNLIFAEKVPLAQFLMMLNLGGKYGLFAYISGIIYILLGMIGIMGTLKSHKTFLELHKYFLLLTIIGSGIFLAVTWFGESNSSIKSNFVMRFRENFIWCYISSTKGINECCCQDMDLELLRPRTGKCWKFSTRLNFNRNFTETECREQLFDILKAALVKGHIILAMFLIIAIITLGYGLLTLKYVKRTPLTSLQNDAVKQMQ